MNYIFHILIKFIIKIIRKRPASNSSISPGPGTVRFTCSFSISFIVINGVHLAVLLINLLSLDCILWLANSNFNFFLLFQCLIVWFNLLSSSFLVLFFYVSCRRFSFYGIYVMPRIFFLWDLSVVLISCFCTIS